MILKLAYGYTAKEENDPIVRIAEEAMDGFSKASEPGAFLVDRFPLCESGFLHHYALVGH